MNRSAERSRRVLSIVFGVCIDELDIVLDSSGSDCNKK